MDGPFGGTVGRFADSSQAIERARQRELRGTQTVDEVAAPDPPGVLERAEDRVDPGEAAIDPFAGHGFAGQHPVAFQQRQGLRVQAFRRGQLGRGFHERPSTRRLGWTERGQATRPRPRPVAAGRALPAQGPEGRERVVRDLADPDEIPQRVEHRSIRPTPSRGVDLAVEARSSASQVFADQVVALALRSLGAIRRRDRPERIAARPEQRDPPVVAAKAPPPHPADLAHRPELVEQARLVAGHAGRQHITFQDGRRDRDAGQLVHDLREALEGGGTAERRGVRARPADRRHAMPRREEAAQGSRIDRLHFAPQPGEGAAAQQPKDIGIAPFPFRATRAELTQKQEPLASRRSRPSPTIPAGRPQRRAGSGVRNGPCVRANRASSPSSAPAAGPRNAAGTPTGAVTPTPSR